MKSCKHAFLLTKTVGYIDFCVFIFQVWGFFFNFKGSHSNTEPSKLKQHNNKTQKGKKYKTLSRTRETTIYLKQKVSQRGIVQSTINNIIIIIHQYARLAHTIIMLYKLIFTLCVKEAN